MKMLIALFILLRLCQLMTDNPRVIQIGKLALAITLLGMIF